MKQINYKVNTRTGKLTLEQQSKETMLQELENMSTSLTFIFDKVISDDNKMLILFINGEAAVPLKLDRISSNKFGISIPRDVMIKGRLTFTIHHYDKDLIDLAKYSPDTYLYVKKSLDITADIMERRPDIFADILYRLEKLEKIVYKDKTQA